tara:strand:- start:131 stop:883 length:753 start_codon:yes stop_codon:yes gene_type:complete
MPIPASRQNLKDYAFRRLGHPVIEINVDDSQIEDRVDDALQFFAEYHFDGVEKMFYKHLVTSTDITNGYINTDDVDSSIISVTRLFQFSESTINMFDIRYQMAINDFYGLRSGLSNMHYYDQIKRHLSLIQQTLDPEKQIRFSRVTNKLYGDFNWSEDLSAGEYLMIEAYTILDPETYTEIYNDRLLKQYVTALIKRQWGANLSKFENIQLPGGVSFNGTQIFEQAQQEIEKIEEEVQLRYELPPHFMTG